MPQRCCGEVGLIAPEMILRMWMRLSDVVGVGMPVFDMMWKSDCLRADVEKVGAIAPELMLEKRAWLPSDLAGEAGMIAPEMIAEDVGLVASEMLLEKRAWLLQR